MRTADTFAARNRHLAAAEKYFGHDVTDVLPEMRLEEYKFKRDRDLRSHDEIP